ncbi:hypothetical protein J2X85_001599 [Microbacterium trichothecenolyticum]|uniref:hypothetical protein n=1 Tax=Microbacterium trichothecenolyticum TaxID=69370 RepID=UPI0028570907|nr:hypothetical protein [Microbacterium trichothecenolyticum]MDR7184576.1 hypothetical protein [Microbacterium trichothecenolyticum]
MVLPTPQALQVVRIKIGDDRPAPQPDPLGRARLGYAADLSTAELWERGRGVWKAKLPSVAESDLVLFASNGIVVLVGSIDGVTFVGDRVAITGRPDPTHPLIGAVDPLENASRNPIAYGAVTTVPATIGARSYGEVFSDAVAILTEAARLRRPQLRQAPTGDWEPDPSTTAPADFPEFVTLALAATAANIGGVYAAVAGRPGSWEAAAVSSLLDSTVGADESDLWRHRTEPVAIRTNVATVLADHTDAWSAYQDAEAELYRREDEELELVGSDLDEEYGWVYDIPTEGRQPVPRSSDAAPWSWEAWRNELAGDGYSPAEIQDIETSIPEMSGAYLFMPKSEEAATELRRRTVLRSEITVKYEELRDRLEQQRRREWAAYGAALKTRIESDAAGLVGLTVPLSVTIDTETDDMVRSVIGDYSLENTLIEAAAEHVTSPADLPGTPLQRLDN